MAPTIAIKPKVKKAALKATEVKAKVSSEETPVTAPIIDPFADLDDDELDGVALSAKLNAGIERNFVEVEYGSKIGVFDSPMQVENVPPGMVYQWSTPTVNDQGQHLNYLLGSDPHSTAPRFRHVHPREMTRSRSNRGAMFVSSHWEADERGVKLYGSYLLVAYKSYADALRIAQAEESRQRVSVDKSAYLEDASGPLARSDPMAQMSTDRHEQRVDVSNYNPMRPEDS